MKKDSLPEGVAEFIAEWLNLVEKMVDTGRVMDSKYSLPAKYDPDQCHVPFRPGRYLARVHQMAFKAINEMWGKSSLKANAPKVNSPKLLETLLAVLRHVIKSEEFVRKQNDKENKEDEDHPKNMGLLLVCNFYSTVITEFKIFLPVLNKISSIFMPDFQFFDTFGACSRLLGN